MPPRAAKKAGSASGGKKTPGKRTPKAQTQQQVEEAPKPQVNEEVKVQEPVVEEKKAEVVVEAPSQPEPESKPEPNGSVAEKDEEEPQEVLEEEDKGERLDLDDNEVEYDQEEIGVDYDDKGTEDEEPQEEEEVDGEEEHEEGDGADVEEGEEEDDDMEEVGEEDVEGAGDEEQGEEEQADEGHGELAEREQEELAEREDEEHHDVVKERRKRKEFEVFVGGLDKDASEDDLKKVFSAVGEIVEVRLMMHPQTKKNKGFAFLRFATVEQAKRAVKELKNPVVNGKQCGVTPSQDSDTLFLGNICKSWTKEALKEKLKQYGIDSVDDLTLVEDSNNEGMNRGFAFLEFSSRSDAMDAYKRLQKRDVVFGVDRNAKVAFADSFIEPDDEIMAQVKTVFVDGLPASWDEDRVKDHLKKYGEIEKVELARNMPSAKRKDFGFVTFDTHDNAVVCAESINNAELGDGDNKVKVRARLSRPLQRGKGKPTGRGDFRSGRGAPRGGRLSWSRPAPRSFPARSVRASGGRLAPIRGRGFKPIGYRDRRPAMAVAERVRPLPPPPRSYSRKPVPAYPRSSSKRDFVRREELPPRSRVAVDYGSRAAPERRSSSYKVDDYAPRGSSYSDVARVPARPAPRRVAYVDEVYERRFERPPPSYREERPRDYDSIPGSKRPYSAVEDVSPRYVDAGVRQSRTRLDYGVGGSSSQYADTYGDRVGRSQLGYAGSRSSLSAQEPQGVYGSRPGMSYAGGSYGTGDGGSYSSSYGRDYPSRGADMGDKQYSSLYSSRDLGGSSYLGGGGGSRSYY